jgi:hypothetical protein
MYSSSESNESGLTAAERKSYRLWTVIPPSTDITCPVEQGRSPDASIVTARPTKATAVCPALRAPGAHRAERGIEGRVRKDTS